jgi:DNA-binding MarR family transcriptional regulator
MYPIPLTVKIPSGILNIKSPDYVSQPAMEITAAAEDVARELLAILPRLNRVVSRELRSEFGDDATIVQVRVLSALDEAPLTLSALARKREVSLQAASEHVQSLVARGWVVRTPDPNDRRQQLLSLTETGLRQLEQVREHITEQFTPIVAQMLPHEVEGIHHGLAALRRILSEQPLPD